MRKINTVSLNKMRKIKINSMNKKGEITTEQLVTIIILIVSFVVILFFIFRLNLKATTDKEICHNSVVMKSTTKGFIGKLNCKTNYICISGGGECEEISPTIKVKVNPNSKEEIMKAIADEMADCWWMFGEGEYNYLGLGEAGVAKTTCAICSIIGIDEEILNKNYQISYREFYEYLNKAKIDETKTYFNYLYEFRDIDEFQNEADLKIDIDENFILDKGKYAIITGVKSGKKLEILEGEITLPSLKRIFIRPYYVKSDEIVSKLDCQEFITKS